MHFSGLHGNTRLHERRYEFSPVMIRMYICNLSIFTFFPFLQNFRIACGGSLGHDMSIVGGTRCWIES